MIVPSELDFFAVLARLHSLSGAARALGMTPPAASRRLAQMEARLGVRLVNRSTRTLSLTREGDIYLAHALAILADLRRMDEAVSGGAAALRGLLRVNATLGFGRTTIAPLLSAFARQHADIALELTLSDSPVDLVGDGVDLAVRFGAVPDQRLHARLLMSNRRYLCASPRYLERHGVPATLADLARHRCIVHRQNDDAHGVWRFSRDGQDEVMKVGAAMASNDGDVVLGWALDGHGILIRSEWDAAKYLASGRLVRLLEDFTLPSADLFAYYASKTGQPARARALVDFLAGKLQGALTVK
ncbi:LysR family transcriptional regulator [Massilia sp. DWR3-1-1]|uniref:LysR family transcriptional regulator n=1 Tax=Massilia sp. DWR3-1-1 TaxID=2804559 RepID=UPI003CF5886D